MVKNNKFLKDNFYLFSGSIVMSAFAFFFHFYLGRTLSIENYGVIGVLLALIGFITIPMQVLQISLTNFVASLKVKNKLEELKYLYHASLKKLNRLFFLLFLISLVVNIYLSQFLKIDYLYLTLISLTLIFVPFLSVTRGFLQGLQLFKNLALGLSLEGIAKFVLGVILVSIGLGVGGAISAIVLSILIASIYNYSVLKKQIIGKYKKFKTKEIYDFAGPVLLTLILLVSFYSLDLILVKHFFTGIEAGNYAVINLMGKIVLFVSFSIIDVMFPKAVELRENGKSHKGLLFNSFLLMSFILVPLLGIYFFFGEFLVSLLFGAKYASVGSLIWVYGIFMGGVSISKLFCMYLLSFKKYIYLYFLLLINILEVLFISFNHETLSQVIYILAGLGLFLFLISGITAYLFSKSLRTSEEKNQ